MDNYFDYHYDDYEEYLMMHCEKMAAELYPDAYHKMKPYVVQKCEDLDIEGDPRFDPFPDKEAFEEMLDSIYNSYRKEAGYRSSRYNAGRDILSFILIEELLGRRRGRRRRRRRRRRRYYYNHYPNYYY